MNIIRNLLYLSILVIVEAKKIFIDNDGLTGLQALFPLYGGHEIVGISMSFGSASTVDSTGMGYEVLKEYNLSSCIPLYVGANQPLIRTNETFHIWEQLFGELVWQGAFSPTYEDSFTWDNITYNDTLPGAVALINAVKQYKDSDPVVIFAAGMMTTVAQAISLYPNLAQESGGLYVMGGYFDNQYSESTGNAINFDINTDINLMQDPEAAQIVLTAEWPELIIGGNVTNYLVPSQQLYDKLIARGGGLDKINSDPYLASVQNIVFTGNYSNNNDQQTLPFWDEVVSSFMAFPDMIKSSIDVNCAVDTSYYSPFYGNLRIWGQDFAPKNVKTGNATIITSIDDDRFYAMMIDILYTDWRQYCYNKSYKVYE